MAKNKNGAESTLPITSFEIQCGPDNTEYGFCKPSCDITNKIINPELKCKETFDDFGLSLGFIPCCKT